MTDSITAQLKQASEGLLFSTESDAPFKVEEWKMQGKLTPARLLQLTNHQPDAPVEVVNVEEFFAIATSSEDWHDEEERETVQRFQDLVSVQKQNLCNIQVYRVGKINIDAYIIGVTPSGHSMGLSTQLVET